MLSKLGVADHTFAQAWWLALVVGLVVTVGTALTGLVDWLSITRGTRALEDRDHAHGRDGDRRRSSSCSRPSPVTAATSTEPSTTGAFLLTLVGFAALSAGGWLGGAITYVHGMRVLSLPDEPAARAASPVPHEEKVEAEA